MKCKNFYYNNDGNGTYNVPYEETCHHANHIFHMDPIKFAEKYLDIKLYPWQKLVLQWATMNKKYILLGRKIKMQLNEKHMRTIKMFNASYSRACFHHKKRVRKKNYARARYMWRRGNQISRKEWKKYVRHPSTN